MGYSVERNVPAWGLQAVGWGGPLRLHDLFFGGDPGLEAVAVSPPGCLIGLMRALGDVDLKFWGAPHRRCRRFLCRIFGHGALLFAAMANRLTGGGQNC